MPLINRHERCVGLTLFKWKQRRVELWYCPSGYVIKEHAHPREDVELMYICGSTMFYRRNMWNNQTDKLKCGLKTFLKCFSVKHFHSHWFTVGKFPLVFINFQKFMPGHKPVSASIDFEITINQ